LIPFKIIRRLWTEWTIHRVSFVFFSIATWATLLASPFFFITSPFCIPSLKIKSPFSFTVVRVVLCWIGLFWVFGCFKIKMVRIEPTTEFLLALHFFITSPFCSPSLKIESSFSFTVVRLVLLYWVIWVFCSFKIKMVQIKSTDFLEKATLSVAV